RPFRGDADDVPGEADALEPADQPAARIELPAREAVAGGGGEGVVVVVPGLAEGRQREPGEVARVVAGGEAATAEEVAERVDGEGGVVEQEDAHRSSPEQAGETS